MFRNLLAGAGLLVLSAAATYAATATGNLGVSVTIPLTCTVTGDSVVIASLSNIGGAGSQQATLSLPVTCPNGANFTTYLDYGAHANGTQRRMHANGYYINYDLYSDAGYTTPFPAVGLPMTGTGGPINLPIYARLPAGQPAVPIGTYTDNVQVTIAY